MPADGQEYQRKTLRGFTGVISVVLALLVGINFSQGASTVAWNSLFGLSVFVVAFVATKRTRRLAWWAHGILAVVAVIITKSALVKGGLPSVTLGWAPVVLILASLTTGWFGALVWTGLMSAAYGYVFWAVPQVSWPAELGGPEPYLVIRIMSLWTLFWLLQVYDRVAKSAMMVALTAAEEAEAGRIEVEQVRDQLAEQNAILTHARADAEAAREQTEAAMRMRNAFIANMSHEIRTPLNATLGLSRMMEATPLNHEQRGYNQALLDSGQHLLELVNQILDLSKLQEQKLTLEQRPMKLVGVVRAVLGLFKVTSEQGGVKLRCTLDPKLPSWVQGDEARLRQVLINLVGNALKFTTEGSVSLNIGPADGGGIHFEVRDTGVGIPTEVIPSLFDAFTQADTSTTRRYGGTGLGLTISQQLVQLMGGTITVESAPGEGSTFAFVLPLEVVEPVDETMSGDGMQLMGVVLLVEDNVINQKVASFVLQELGLSVQVANNGQEAVEAASSLRYDVILMDCHMPVMDGFEAAEQIRASLTQPPPIVALSASALEEDRERCAAVGMSGFLGKPIDPDEMRRELALYLKQAA